MRENTLRGIGPSAQNARKTHCKHGHSDWRTNLHGERVCRACEKIKHLRDPRASWNRETS